jgi:hypothetical protein
MPEILKRLLADGKLRRHRTSAREIEDDGEPFEEKMERLMARMEGQFAESSRLEEQIRNNQTWLWKSGGD